MVKGMVVLVDKQSMRIFHAAWKNDFVIYYADALKLLGESTRNRTLIAQMIDAGYLMEFEKSDPLDGIMRPALRLEPKGRVEVEERRRWLVDKGLHWTVTIISLIIAIASLAMQLSKPSTPEQQMQSNEPFPKSSASSTLP